MSAKVKRTCKQCGKEFYVYKSALEKTNASGNFCCRKCYNEYQKTLKGEKNNHYTRVTVKCANCGKEFKQIPSKVKANKNSFCCIKCKHEYFHNYVEGEKNGNWKGGESKYRGNFENVKKRYFAKKQICAACGTSENIHIHHIIPYRLTQDNDIDNLIPLCNKHHKTVEHVTLKFIESFDHNQLSVAKDYLNLLLRGYQFETMAVLRGIRENERR